MAVSNGYLTTVLTADTAVPEMNPDILSWRAVGSDVLTVCDESGLMLGSSLCASDCNFRILSASDADTGDECVVNVAAAIVTVPKKLRLEQLLSPFANRHVHVLLCLCR